MKEVVSSNKKRYLWKALIFSNIFRFMDDLCTFNNNELENDYDDSYSDELELKKDNEVSGEASFLDLLTEFHGKKLAAKLFDIRDVFPFYINLMLYLGSNVLSKIFYASISFKNSIYSQNNNRPN